MPEIEARTNRRRQDRVKAVMPVRVRGTDAHGVPFDVWAHTLDLTPTGARLGAIRHELRKLDTLTVSYHQLRMEFKVMWTKRLDEKGEYQIGLQALSEKEAWRFAGFNSWPAASVRAASGA